MSYANENKATSTKHKLQIRVQSAPQVTTQKRRANRQVMLNSHHERQKERHHGGSKKRKTWISLTLARKTLSVPLVPNANASHLQNSNPNPSSSFREQSNGLLRARYTQVRESVLQRDHQRRLIPEEIGFLVGPVGTLRV